MSKKNQTTGLAKFRKALFHFRRIGFLIGSAVFIFQGAFILWHGKGWSYGVKGPGAGAIDPRTQIIVGILLGLAGLSGRTWFQ